MVTFRRTSYAKMAERFPDLKSGGSRTKRKFGKPKYCEKYIDLAQCLKQLGRKGELQNLVKLCKTILKYHSWYLCQISLQIILLPIQRKRSP